MRLAQIYDNKAHWVFDPIERFGTTDLSDRFAPDIVFVDISDKQEVQEGWDYDSETSQFTEPVIVPPEPLLPPEPTDQEKILIALAQQKEENLTIMMAQADAYEAEQANSLTLMLALADLYEMGGVE